MAAPNIANVTSIIGKTMGASLTTTLTTTILTCPSNKVLKINSIIVSNIDIAGVDITCVFNDSSAATYTIGNIVVPVQSSLILLGKDAPIYLEEGDSIEAGAVTDNVANIIISYEEIDDA